MFSQSLYLQTIGSIATSIADKDYERELADIVRALIDNGADVNGVGGDNQVFQDVLGCFQSILEYSSMLHSIIRYLGCFLSVLGYSRMFHNITRSSSVFLCVSREFQTGPQYYILFEGFLLCSRVFQSSTVYYILLQHIPEQYRIVYIWYRSILVYYIILPSIILYYSCNILL